MPHMLLEGEGSNGDAVSEDRTHDLRIMRPTRYQLRYHRLDINWLLPLLRAEIEKASS